MHFSLCDSLLDSKKQSFIHENGQSKNSLLGIRAEKQILSDTLNILCHFWLLKSIEAQFCHLVKSKDNIFERPIKLKT